MKQQGPVLYIVCGKPGVGKTTYAMGLANQYGAVLLDIDTVTEPVVKAGLELAGLENNDRDSKQYKKAFREPVYQALFDTAKQNLSINSVVIAGPFSQEIHDPDWDKALANLFGCKVEVHYLQCSESTRRNRIWQRGNPRDMAKLKDWQRASEYYGERRLPACQHILINSEP